MKFSISHRIVAGVTFLLLLSTLGSLSVFDDLRSIRERLATVTEVAWPISMVGYEMEINGVEIGLAVLKYMDRRDPAFRERVLRDSGHFETSYSSYNDLATDAQSKEIGRQVHATYQEFRQIGIAMMDARDEQEKLVTDMAESFLQIDTLIEDKMVPRLRADASQAFGKLELLQDMATRIARNNVWLSYYLKSNDPQYKQRIEADVAHVNADLARYRQFDLAPKERAEAAKVADIFGRMSASTSKKLALHEHIYALESRFIKMRQLFDDLLDEGVQALAANQLAVAKQGADRSVDHALTSLLAAAMLIAATGFIAVWLMIRSIKAPIRDLLEATVMIGHGNLAYRVAEHGDDELAGLARQFNQMTRDLEESTVSRLQLQASEESLQKTNVLLNREIEERKKAQEIIHQMAYFDPLTELPNRRLFNDRLQQAKLSAKRENKPMAVMLMDLDRFKEVNDTLGHQNGDLLLQLVGKRVRSLLRDSDTLARLGGDEFVVLMSGTDSLGAALTAEKITKALQRPFALGDISYEVGMSIGIVVYPEHGESDSDLLRCADVAMYAAKAAHSGYATYDKEHDKHSTERLTLMSEMRVAIETDQLVLHYQPLIHCDDKSIVDVEALVRWNHPKRGLLMPDEFIPLAEKVGAIMPLTLWVLEEALRQGAEWRKAGMDLKVAVNLSASSLHYPQLTQKIGKLLKQYDVPADYLTLEITETAIMSDPGHAMLLLTQLSKMGVGLAIDDFGTGHSSLAYLSRLPIGNIKIDKSFVIGMLGNDGDEIIVRSTIDLSHNLRRTVTAEGVEHAETLRRLGNYGCDMVQGYHISYPLPAAEFFSWLQASIAEGKTLKPPLVEGEA